MALTIFLSLFSLSPFSLARGLQVFLKYFHAEQLLRQLRNHRRCYMFFEHVCLGFTARIRYRKLLAAKEVQQANVSTMAATAEVL